MRSFDHTAIEKKWQERWATERLYETPDVSPGKENAYVLVEFPYPSGDLHIGHWFAFAVPDIYARFERMCGKNVLYPIGFDSFGLPAENAAIKRKLNPCTWTYDNIRTMSEQLKSMGNSFDWSRQVVASDPEYYRWTQWLFLKLFEQGLAYKRKSTVPWCDSCKTVLANEQIVGGACERCGTAVTQRDLDQWYFKITAYADRLLNDLDALPWSEDIKRAQREWIGKSSGAELQFSVADTDITIDVFTTRPDTLYGVTYLVLAPEHAAINLLQSRITNWDEVARYRETTQTKKELERKEGKEKTGVELTGVQAINPANGERVPVWIADYVLASYGTGAIMAVPAHDERDREFARSHGLPVKMVVDPIGGPAVPDRHAFDAYKDMCARVLAGEESYCDEGNLMNSGSFTGKFSTDVAPDITVSVGGTPTTQYRLRDWLLSRQRYWGCPIPIVYDPEGKPHAIPDEHLPWLLPEDVDHTPTGEAPLARSVELRERTERIFGPGWRSEVDTMDTFVDSSWYFLRYLDPHNTTEFSSLEKQRAWMPVAHYSGGAEHVTMHLLYARFFNKVLYDLGLVTESEPFARRMNRGLILGPDGHKMSKSKGNVINPDEHVRRVGADTVKMYLAFIGPYNEVGQYPWDLGGIAGIRRFLERVWGLRDRVAERSVLSIERDDRAGEMIDQVMKSVGEGLAAFKFNTAISQIMVLVNALDKQTQVARDTYETVLKLLAPFAPHLTDELWESLGHTTSIHTEGWPKYDAEKLAHATVTIAVQVNGKLRGTFTVQGEIDETTALERARALPAVAKQLEHVMVQRSIYVPGKLINFVGESRPVDKN